MSGMQIRRPCDAAWSEMRSVEGGRHCNQCDQRVNDLTHVTEARATAVAWLYGGGLGFCARIRQNSDGEAQFAASTLDISMISCRRSLPVLLAFASLAAPLVGCGATNRLASPATNRIETAPQVGSDEPKQQGCHFEPAVGDVATGIALSAATPAPAAPVRGETRSPTVDVLQGFVEEVPPRPHFANGSSKLDPRYRHGLDEMARLLAERPEIRLVHVVGHTDKTEATPQKLALARAQVVVDYLREAGVDSSRLAVEQKGHDEPVDTKDTDDDRAQNRRVDFHIDEGLARNQDIPPN